MAHLGVKQRSPFKKSFSPARRQILHFEISIFYTLRGFGGRGPLNGTGVKSVIVVTAMPPAESDRMADSRPAPMPRTKIRAASKPVLRACSDIKPATLDAAYGVPFLAPEKPSEPALPENKTLPCSSVTVMIVLLYVELIYTKPDATRRFVFFFAAEEPVPAEAGLPDSPFLITRFFPILFFIQCSFSAYRGAAHITAARSGICPRSLSAHGQAFRMPQAAVRSHIF